MKAINLQEKLQQFDDYWNPRIVGRMNGQLIKLAKLKGDFVWHKHDEEDELFQVISGQLTMEFRDRREVIHSGEFIIVPRGVEHKPSAKEECAVLLFEPASTLNTGDAEESKMTRSKLEEL